MRDENLNNKIAKGFFWSGIEQFGTRGFAIVFSFLLIRLLSPAEFGTLAIVMSFILVSEVLINSGLGMALVQKVSPTQADENSIFAVNLFLSFLLYAALFVAAPWISRFYHAPELILLLRVVGLSLIFFSLGIVQEAKMMRLMEFRLRFRINFAALVISGIIGVTMAWLGYGVWALAMQTLSKSFFTMVGLWIYIGWRPGLKFDFRALLPMAKFGANQMISALLEKICFAVYPLIIGKVYSKSELGIFDKGKYCPQTIIGSVSNIFLIVMFPAFTKLQNDKVALAQLFSRSHQLIAFLVVPLTFGMTVCAPSLVRAIMGPQWVDCIPVLQIFCFVFAWLPFNLLCTQLLNATGHSGMRLGVAIIQKSLELLVVVSLIKLGIIVISIGIAVHAFLLAIIHLAFCSKIIDYDIVQLWKDIRAPMVLSIIMTIVTYVISLFIKSDFILLIVQVIIGFVTYFGLAIICKVSVLQMAFNLIRKRKLRENGN